MDQEEQRIADAGARAPRPWLASPLPSFVLTYVTVVVLVSALFVAYQWVSLVLQQDAISMHEEARVDLVRHITQNEMATIGTDIRFLSKSENLTRYLRNESMKNWALVAKEFAAFARQKGIYDQVRFLGETGVEAVRINYNHGDPAIVAPEDLQDKSGRYYFKDAVTFGRNEIYVSPLDLNIEHGEIESPIKPMIRIGTPVFDGRGRKRGVLLVNYLAQNMLSKMQRLLATGEGVGMLVNSDGYWFIGPDQKDLWGFMYGNRRGFMTDFPEAWKTVSLMESGRVAHTDGSTFIFTTVYPLTGLTRARDGLVDGYWWKIVSWIPPKAVLSGVGPGLPLVASLYFLLVGLALPGAWYFAHVRHQRRQSEQALRESQQKERMVLQSTGEGIFGIDLGGNFSFCNPAAVRLLGMDSAADLLGRNTYDVIDLRDASGRRVPRESCRICRPNWTGENILSDQEMFRHADGTVFPVEYRARPMVVDGKIAGTVVTFTDITERKQAEERIKTLARFPNQNPSPVIRISKQGQVLYANPPSQVVLSTWEAEEGEPVPDTLKDLIAEILEDGKTREIDVSCGRQVFSLMFAPFVDEGYVNIYGRDITEAREAERRLRQAQKMEAIGTMAGGIAHDFNNILTAIVGYGHLLLDDLPDGSQERGDAEKILNACSRAKTLVGQILTFSRGGGGERRPVDVRAMVHEVLQFIRATTPATIELRPNIDSAQGAVMADPTEIHQLLMNLCVNAVDAVGTRPGVIEITLRNVFPQSGDASVPKALRRTMCLQLVVSDNGQGMDPTTLERIFDPFFTTKEVGVGTGMGLAVVHGIVRKLRGDIQAASLPGKGTTFTVHLPVACDLIEEAEAESKGDPVGTERVLLVDDEVEVAEAQSRGLERLGYVVKTASGGDAAQAAIREDGLGFDLVVTDQNMPGLSGVGFARWVHNVVPGLPVILCSGTRPEASGSLADLGIRLFLQKPFEPRDLAQAIRKVMDEKSRSCNAS